ncbi:MAG TPA: hypothetical protein VL977_00150, partial [Solirubrobacteraceae bacterium]|nr:hypothetical protein [Solirubrobacteraceae bacterium]
AALARIAGARAPSGRVQRASYPAGAMRPKLIGALAGAALALAALGGGAAQASGGCRVLSPPGSLGATLLALHRDYMRYQPDVHNPKISGPVGAVHLGQCHGEQYALATFRQRYNGVNFGTTDQPERFQKPPGQGWVDIGNTGGDPCGSMPTALLVAWKIVRACPG